MQGAFPDLHDGLDADFFPILGQELRYVGPRAESGYNANFKCGRLAIRQQADALRVALAEAKIIQHFVGLGGVIVDEFLGIFVAWEIRMPWSRNALASFAKTKEGRFLNLIAIDGVRQRNAEISCSH